MELVEKLLIDEIDLWSSADSIKSSGRGRVSAASINCYGVEKLRELIFQLAIRGRLLDQCATDIPASHLLKEAETYASGLASRAVNRKKKTYQSVSAEEISFSTPEGWEWVRLGQLGEWGAGATPLRGTASFYGGDIPWFKSGELSQDFIRVSEETVTELALEKCSLRMNRPGDVLLAMYGATIGKASILEVSGTTNQAVCACTPYPGISNRYLLLLLKAMRANFIGQGAGGAQPNISREKIIVTPVAIPPAEEQERISLKVNELMALCKKLEGSIGDAMVSHQALVNGYICQLLNSDSAEKFQENWNSMLGKFDEIFISVDAIERLKNTAIDLGLRGKFSVAESTEEAIADLLNLCSKNSVDSRQKKVGRKGPESKAADLYEIPKDWSWVQLSQLATFENGDRSKNYPSRDQFVEDGIAFINAGHLFDGKIDYSSMNFINQAAYDNLRSGKVKEGDILFCLRGSLGKFAVVERGQTGAIASSLIIVRPLISDLCEYLSVYFSSSLARAQILKFDNGTAQPNLAGSDLALFKIPLPPLGEQQYIVAKLKELLSLCDQLKINIVSSKELQREIADTFVRQALA
ncbi:hypothetical protein G6715_04050 [Polynucleobacter paneuropaeus]|nr:hypothetical protein [Polynucleobacter paneuropaeus]